MASTVADLIVATLRASGVQRVYGIPGDSVNGFTDALRRDGSITWEHVRDTVDALLPLLTRKTDSAPLHRMTAHYRQGTHRADQEQPARPGGGVS
jgi:thiamine pyrophosphate-dependent acetolactate synthase large subunit-like protein